LLENIVKGHPYKAQAAVHAHNIGTIELLSTRLKHELLKIWRK